MLGLCLMMAQVPVLGCVFDMAQVPVLGLCLMMARVPVFGCVFDDGAGACVGPQRASAYTPPDKCESMCGCTTAGVAGCSVCALQPPAALVLPCASLSCICACCPGAPANQPA